MFARKSAPLPASPLDASPTGQGLQCMLSRGRVYKRSIVVRVAVRPPQQRAVSPSGPRDRRTWADHAGKLDKTLEAARLSPQDVHEVRMTVQNNSFLAISWLPTMRYMPMWSDAHRTAIGQVLEVDGSRLRVIFLPEDRNPSLSWRTTFVNALWPLRIPAMPPGVEVEIKSNQLEGWLDLETGLVDLHFDSEFGNVLAGSESGIPLKVTSRMTSEELEGNLFRAKGQRVQQDARAKLVALSDVPRTSDPYQTWMLQLPTDALSILNVQFEFVLKSKGSPDYN